MTNSQCHPREEAVPGNQDMADSKIGEEQKPTRDTRRTRV